MIRVNDCIKRRLLLLGVITSIIIINIVVASEYVCAIDLEDQYSNCKHEFEDEETNLDTGQKYVCCKKCVYIKYILLHNNCKHKWKKDSSYEDSSESYNYRRGTRIVYVWSIYDTYRCKNCGDYLSADQVCKLVGHDYSKWEIIRKPTKLKKGKKERYCKRVGCRLGIQVKSIPKRRINKNEKRAYKTVLKYLKAAKKYKVKRMNSCFAKKSNKYKYPTRKINWIFKKYNKGIKWDFRNIKKKGKSYIVKVRVKAPYFLIEATDAYFSALEWAYGKNGQIKWLPYNFEDIFAKKFNKLVKKRKKDTWAITHNIKVKKDNGKWKISKQTRGVVDIATGFMYWGRADGKSDFLSYINE